MAFLQQHCRRFRFTFYMYHCNYWIEIISFGQGSSHAVHKIIPISQILPHVVSLLPPGLPSQTIARTVCIVS